MASDPANPPNTAVSRGDATITGGSGTDARGTMTGTTIPCPDDQTLGAYLDGKLDRRARRRIEAHIADCPSCYELVADYARTVEDGEVSLEAPQHQDVVPPPVVPFYRASWVLPAALATAALLVAAVYFVPQWTNRDDARVATTLAALVESVGTDRFVDARLTPAFTYGPPPSSLRSATGESEVRPAIRAAAARVEQIAGERQDANALNATAIAQLAVGDVDRAISTFDQAVGADGADARVQANLAAALLERARRQGAAADIQRAVETARRSTELAPSLPEAWFNLALAHLAARQPADARAAMDRLQQLEPSSPWLDELRTRISRES